MLYTVKNLVTENPDLKYNDSVTNLFLYTEGTVGGSKELEDLLNHMTHTTTDNALDSDLKQIQKIVDSVKSDREVGERYMSMEKIMKSAEYHGFIEGKAEERTENIKVFIETLQELDISTTTIKNKLYEKFKLSETEADEYIKKYYK